MSNMSNRHILVHMSVKYLLSMHSHPSSHTAPIVSIFLVCGSNVEFIEKRNEAFWFTISPRMRLTAMLPLELDLHRQELYALSL